MKTFGEKLKELRNDKGLTQKQAAEELSVTISTLSHWECNYQEPSFKDLMTLCHYYEVSADYLLGLKDEY